MKSYRFFLLIGLCAFTISANAQPGIGEMGAVEDELTTWWQAMVDFSFVLSGIIGLCGAITIFYNWQMGKPNTTAHISAWFFSALFLLLSGVFMRALVGY